MLLRLGVTYPWLSKLLKEVFVEVADEDFRLGDKRQTDSRISLLTGVHRKDVKRLRPERRDQDLTPPTVSLGSQLVAVWIGSPEYLDSDGRPQPLPRHPADDGPSFEGLVESVSKDIRPRAVLDEWLRLGAAHIDEHDRVCLSVEAFVPDKGFDEKAYFLGRNLRDHIAAAAHNLAGLKPAFLERSVYYDELTPESVRELAQLAEETGMKALQAVNRRAMNLQERDRSKPDARHRINFGIYEHDTAAASAEVPAGDDSNAKS